MRASRGSAQTEASNNVSVDPRKILAPLAPSMQKLDDFIESQCELFEPSVANCVRYVASNQGKRLRPALTIFSANAQSRDAIGQVNDPVLKVCAIIEMVHIATLVHDDIMDEAQIRRNRLTAAAKWGHEISVLLGDCLFAHALVLASSFPTTYVCQRVAEATNIVCSGEILQTQRRFDLKLTIPDYLKIIEMKTAALFAVACELGAYLSGATPERCRNFYEFGRLLGIAYQIYDDCLDLFGAEAEIGKSLGTDLQKGKLTLPLILLLEQAKDPENHLISSMLLNEHGNSKGMLLEFIQRYDTLRQSALQAQKLIADAVDQLKDVPECEGRSSLLGLAHYIDSELSRMAS